MASSGTAARSRCGPRSSLPGRRRRPEGAHPGGQSLRNAAGPYGIAGGLGTGHRLASSPARTISASGAAPDLCRTALRSATARVTVLTRRSRVAHPRRKDHVMPTSPALAPRGRVRGFRRASARTARRRHRRTVRRRGRSRLTISARRRQRLARQPRSPRRFDCRHVDPCGAAADVCDTTLVHVDGAGRLARDGGGRRRHAGRRPLRLPQRRVGVAGPLVGVSASTGPAETVHVAAANGAYSWPRCPSPPAVQASPAARRWRPAAPSSPTSTRRAAARRPSSSDPNAAPPPSPRWRWTTRRWSRRTASSPIPRCIPAESRPRCPSIAASAGSGFHARDGANPALAFPAATRCGHRRVPRDRPAAVGEADRARRAARSNVVVAGGALRARTRRNRRAPRARRVRAAGDRLLGADRGPRRLRAPGGAVPAFRGPRQDLG